MNKVRDKLLKLVQTINSVGSSVPMLYVKLDFIEKMELESDENVIFKNALKKIETLADKAIKDIEDYNSLLELKNIYSESYIFSKLKSLLVVEKMPEQSNKTPDFKVKYRGADIFIELKSLNMIDGTFKHKNIMNESMQSKIDAETQIENGTQIAFGEQLIKPYKKCNKPYDCGSVKLVIESLIDKINQNIERAQYSLGDTVLLVDLSGQLPLMAKPSQAIQEKYYDTIGRSDVSGELWHIAFGEMGSEIYRALEFEGADNKDGQLSKEGILISHPYIKGLVFHIDEDFYSLGEVSKDNLNVINCLEYLSKGHSIRPKKMKTFAT